MKLGKSPLTFIIFIFCLKVNLQPKSHYEVLALSFCLRISVKSKKPFEKRFLLSQRVQQSEFYYFLHALLQEIMIATISIKTIPKAIYAKNAGKIFSSNTIIKRRIAITNIPIPNIRHNFFSSYFAFSSCEAVLYPEISQLPCPEIKTTESIINIVKAIHTVQSGPVDKSANFIIYTSVNSVICIILFVNRFHFRNFCFGSLICGNKFF